MRPSNLAWHSLLIAEPKSQAVSIYMERQCVCWQRNSIVATFRLASRIRTGADSLDSLNIFDSLFSQGSGWFLHRQPFRYLHFPSFKAPPEPLPHFLSKLPSLT